ncbi:hypothetical protein ACFL6E_02100 [Candidatus Neomarinimicrobiota bacterium]
MKYVGAVLLILLVFTIMLQGTYSQQQMVEVSFELVPTEAAQPNIVENTITQYSGIRSVNHLRDENRLDIAFDQAKISLDELLHIISSLGYDPVHPTGSEASL